MASSPVQHVTYGELVRLFVRMSLQSFGGPAAHLAMAEDEIVTRRQWLTRAEFLDMVAATNLIPGPNSTETMIHVGHKMRGIPGAIVAGACFIIPAMLITLVLTMLYVQYGAVPEVGSMLWGIQPVIVAIIAVAAYRLIPVGLKNVLLQSLFIVVLLLLYFTPIPEVLVMLGGGVVYAVATTLRARPTIAPALLLPLLGLPQLVQTAVTAVTPTVLDVFWYFLRIGSILFGSGYVLISYLQDDLVLNLGWLTNRQLLDTIAIGQFTPGPVLTTATAVGYVVGGIPAALVATFAIFLPAFVLVIATAPLIPKMRSSRFFSAFLDGVNAATIAAILVALIRLASEAFSPLEPGELAIGGVGLVPVALAIVTALGMVRFRRNATWFVVLGAVLGIALGLL
ncbi:MAG: chromate efflux transporter [Pleurocapsa minor GSE-CHR-MK-17-07R]|jgi:chromate transporter|nr:chromate efflux transporter [Pleurocapsa minor GSE-CHR-MK 17-07R]